MRKQIGEIKARPGGLVVEFRAPPVLATRDVRDGEPGVLGRIVEAFRRDLGWAAIFWTAVCLIAILLGRLGGGKP